MADVVGQQVQKSGSKQANAEKKMHYETMKKASSRYVSYKDRVQKKWEANLDEEEKNESLKLYLNEYEDEISAFINDPENEGVKEKDMEVLINDYISLLGNGGATTTNQATGQEEDKKTSGGTNDKVKQKKESQPKSPQAKEENKKKYQVIKLPGPTLAGAKSISRWMVRNAVKKADWGEDKVDFVKLFLAQPIRTKLLCYYLIEKKGRRETDDDKLWDMILASQASYAPDLENFKKQMIASKILFHKRLVASEIYWDKLGEVWRFAEANNDKVLFAGEASGEGVEKPNPADLKGEEDPKPKQEKKKLTEKEKEEEREKKRENAANLATLTEESKFKDTIGPKNGGGAVEATQGVMENIAALAELLEQIPQLKEAAAFLSSIPSILGSTFTGDWEAVKEELGIDGTKFNLGVTKALTGKTATLVGISSAGIKLAQKVFDQVERLDTAANVLGPVSGGINMLVSFWDAAEAQNEEEAYFSAKQGIESGNMNAEEKETGGNILEIQKRNTRLKDDNAAVKMVQGELMLMSGLLTATGVGASVAIGLQVVSGGIAFANMIHNYFRKKGNRKAAVDDYIHMTRIFNVALRKVGTKENRDKLRKNEDKVKDQLRRKAAAQLRFPTWEALYKDIIEKYAEFIYKRLFFKKDSNDYLEESDQMDSVAVDMLAAMSLKPNFKKKLPNQETIAKKLNA